MKGPPTHHKSTHMAYVRKVPCSQLASARSVYLNFDPCVLLASACIPFLILSLGAVLRPALGLV